MINRKGSSTVLLAIAFLTFALCIAGSIGISRRLTVMSECQAFGRVWTRAVLSEYDRRLLEDYKLMAYWGNEIEVNRKIDAYFSYSASGRLGITIGGTVSDLGGYELGDPDNFNEAMRKGMAGAAVSSLIEGTSRRERHNNISSDPANSDEPEASGSSGRVIGNRVVLDTLPSAGSGGALSADSLVERAKNADDEKGVMSSAAASGMDMAFIWMYLDSSVTTADDKPHYLNNEMEYIVKGSPDDSVNYSSCRRILFLARNALNLAALYKDPDKVELITAAAELITPGPLGAATQLLLAEAWAAMETEKDLDVLYDNGRVPVLKRSDQWMTDLGSVINSSDVRRKLDDESRQLLDDNNDEIRSLSGIGNAAEIITEGLNYDEYLMLMIMCMNSRTRLLRIMDIVQINMKYRYYRDFNLMEYYTGVRYALSADGRSYVFEDSYK